MKAKKRLDPFDGRPCNKLLQGVPGAEHAMLVLLTHAALPWFERCAMKGNLIAKRMRRNISALARLGLEVQVSLSRLRAIST